MLTDATPTPNGSGSLFSSTIIPIIFLIVLLCYCIFKFIKGHIVNVQAGKCRKFNRLFIVLCAMGGLLDFVIIGFFMGWDFNPSDILLYIILLIIPGIVTQCIYFTPYIIANKKCHPHETAIFVLNLFAGWTIIAWIIALIWAYTETKQASSMQQITVNGADELMKYKELLESGVITQDEFDIKKKQIMDI